MRRTIRRGRAVPRRTMPRQRTAAPRGSREGVRAETPAGELFLVRAVACGLIFTMLIALKLLWPGNLAQMRGTLGEWLVRDADFEEAFSAVGHAVSGEGGIIDSLEEAYIAVFGAREAQEVSGTAEIPDSENAPDEASDDPAPRSYYQDSGEAGEGDASAEGSEAQADSSSVDQIGANASEMQANALFADRALPAHTAAEQRILGFDYATPLTGTMTSSFGWRTHPVSGRESFHYGVDLASEEGASICCFADGRVETVGESTELGNYLTVSHDNGFSTLYAHCKRVTAEAGSRVERGEKIAEVGQTGNATGPHLHFEVHEGATYLNPVYYVET